MNSVVIVSAGRGSRMKADINKQFLKLQNKEVIAHTIDKFYNNENIGEIIVVVREDEAEFLKINIIEKYGYKNIKIAFGGSERQDSVYNGLKMVDENPKVTDYMPKIIDYIDGLVKNGSAYVNDGEVFFDVLKDEKYGELSKINVDDLIQGARIEENSKKKSSLDFLLWKKTEKGIKWESPWCLGRPGWHTEGVISPNTIFNDAGSIRIADRRMAVVEYFRDNADIMIATEAAAEGLNLQFCSLVVNYDLPWNPQRIEQRIGRCHRYGQKHDVVVVNFVNLRNYADVRVFDILNEKFNLFDDIFGASDEILGKADAIDFETRIWEIYQQCRTEEEINAAFDSLQADMQ